nr:transposase-like protein, PS3IS - Helicobacter pylori (strain 26695) [Helicobacter pylori]
MKVNKGFKFRLYPTKEQQDKLQHCFFVYNQAYNIGLNELQEQYETNKDSPPKERKYKKSSELDNAIKQCLRARDLPFSAVIAQQARMNVERALKDAFKVKNRGFPKFKNSKSAKQSFSWNNQGFSIKESDDECFKTFTLMKMPLLMRMHRDFPLILKNKLVSLAAIENILLALAWNTNKTLLPKTLKMVWGIISLILVLVRTTMTNRTLSNTKQTKNYGKMKSWILNDLSLLIPNCILKNTLKNLKDYKENKAVGCSLNKTKPNEVIFTKPKRNTKPLTSLVIKKQTDTIKSQANFQSNLNLKICKKTLKELNSKMLNKRVGLINLFTLHSIKSSLFTTNNSIMANCKFPHNIRVKLAIVVGISTTSLNIIGNIGVNAGIENTGTSTLRTTFAKGVFLGEISMQTLKNKAFR